MMAINNGKCQSRREITFSTRKVREGKDSLESEPDEDSFNNDLFNEWPKTRLNSNGFSEAQWPLVEGVQVGAGAGIQVDDER